MSALFSVIIPVYQAESFLEKSVQSVLNQTVGVRYEIILVNDGSKDTSGELCDKLVHMHPDIIRVIHKENEGPYIARQIGAANSTGEYLIFLDSDDLFIPDAFQVLSSRIEKDRPDLVLFGWRNINSQGRVFGETLPSQVDTIIYGDQISMLKLQLLNTNIHNSLCSKCIRKDVFPTCYNLENYVGFVFAEDRFDSLGVFDRVDIVSAIAQPLYQYLQNDTSTVHNITLRHYRNTEFTVKEEDKYIQKWSVELSDILPLYEKRIKNGLLCLRSLWERVSAGIGIREDYEEAVTYIAHSEMFNEAYAKCKSVLPWFYKVGYNLLLRNCKLLLRLWLWCYYMAKKISDQLLRKS